MQGGVGSYGDRKGGLCASHSASWVCWAGFDDLRPKAASPRGTPREGSGSLSPQGKVDLESGALDNSAILTIGAGALRQQVHRRNPCEL